MNGEVQLRLTNRALLLVLAALGLFWLVRQATHIFVVLFLAVLLASSVSTAARRLERLRFGRGVAILLVYLLVIAVLTVLVALVIPLITDEVRLLQQNLPRYEAQANAVLARLPAQAGAPLQVNDLAGQLGGRVQEVAGALSRGALTFGSTIVTTLLVFVIAYFLAADARFAERVVTRFMPPTARPRALTIMGRIGNGLGDWVRAQLLLALFFGLAFGLGLALMGLPFALTLGAIGGVLEIIPYVGGLLTIVLAVLVAATTGKLWLVVAALGWYIIVVNIEAHIVAPKLVGEVVGLHPLVVVLALFLGAETLGILGALLAVPLAVIAQVLLDEFWRFPDTAGADTSASTSMVGDEDAPPLQPGIGGSSVEPVAGPPGIHA